jgi:penicillin-binding protein 1A
LEYFDQFRTERERLTQDMEFDQIYAILDDPSKGSAQEWATKFGFDADKHPPYLTMALGAGSVTPLQMATGYGVFANGGYYVPPLLITRITDQKGRVLLDVKPTAPDESQRAIPQRNAFMMSQLLQEVTRSGTAARAQAALQRPDIYGKTGTTNDAVDAWFVGFQPTLVAAAWVGYDTPRNLGRRETGGGLSLPIWISFMKDALKNVPVEEPVAPPGVVYTQGEWFYDEFQPGSGVASLGNADAQPLGQQEIPSDPDATQEKRSILDLFRN